MSNSTRTVQDLIGDITTSAQAMGMDVSPKDVGFIISTFIEGLFVDPTVYPVDFNRNMQKIADECAAIKDEE